MKKIIKNTLILTIITVVAGLCLGLVYEITRNRSLILRKKPKKKHGRLYSREQI